MVADSPQPTTGGCSRCPHLYMLFSGEHTLLETGYYYYYIHFLPLISSIWYLAACYATLIAKAA